MLSYQKYRSIFPTLASFSGESFTRRSSLGRVHLVRKNRWGDSKSRMHDRRRNLKKRIGTLLNTGRISQNANPNLINLDLHKIPSKHTRKAYAKIVKKAAGRLAKSL